MSKSFKAYFPVFPYSMSFGFHRRSFGLPHSVNALIRD